MTRRDVVAHGLAEEFADSDQRCRDVARIDRDHPKDDVLGVEQEDPQLLALEGRQLDAQVGVDVLRRADGPACRRADRDADVT